MELCVRVVSFAFTISRWTSHVFPEVSGGALVATLQHCICVWMCLGALVYVTRASR
jgi:hypothetical protein